MICRKGIIFFDILQNHNYRNNVVKKSVTRLSERVCCGPRSGRIKNHEKCVYALSENDMRMHFFLIVRNTKAGYNIIAALSTFMV